MLRVALLDLVHTSYGIHTMTMPLGIGMIGSYMLKKLGSKDIQVRLFKFPEYIIETLDQWKPSVVGISQYCWNSKLSLHIAKHIKSKLPNSLIIAGGPNFETEPSLRKQYLLNYRHVDFCVDYEGEVPFNEIVKRYLEDETVLSIKENLVPDTYCLHPETHQLIEGEKLLRRVNSLDEIPSPYLNGLFDDFYQYNVNPFVQTQRGCPFKCTYCNTSDSYYNKILFCSPDKFAEELEVIARRFAGMHNITLFMANTNFGLYKQDLEIARIIRKVQDKYDWPKHFNVNTGKGLPERVLETNNILKYKYRSSLSLETLTEGVLKNIDRKNISFEKFMWFQKEKEKQGMRSETELILCLPGETKDSFIETLRRVVNANLDMIVVFTLMKLKGTPIASEEASKKYSYVTKYRIVPRQFGLYLDNLIIDTEEVIVATNTFSLEDYIYVHQICYVIEAIYNVDAFKEIKKWLVEHQVDLFEWVLAVYRKTQGEKGKVVKHMNIFTEETVAELWDSLEDIHTFYSKPENYQMLVNGTKGDNLSRKYKTLAQQTGFDEWLSVAIECAIDLILSKNDNNRQEVLKQGSDIKQYISSTRNVGGIFNDKFEGIKKELKFSYDIPSWSLGTENLSHYKGVFFYDCIFTDLQIEELKNLLTRSTNLNLDIQFLYRDGSIKDFWPKLKRKKRF